MPCQTWIGGRGTGVAGIDLPDGVAPLLRRAVRASATGALAAAGREVGGVGEAVERHPHERGAGFEHVRVEGEHVVRHHAAGGRPGGVHPVRVAAVALLDVGHHRHDRDRVAATATPLGGVRPDVEALAEPGLLLGAGVDDDEPVPVGQRAELAAGVEAGTRTAAAVHGHDDPGVCRARVRYVDVHAHPARIGAEVRDLGQRRRRRGRGDREDEARDGECGRCGDQECRVGFHAFDSFGPRVVRRPAAGGDPRVGAMPDPSWLVRRWSNR